MNSKFELRLSYRCEYTSHTQLWVAVRPDLRFDWFWDPYAPRASPATAEKEAMASPFELEFGDSPFDGYPRNFADAKALIYARSKKAGILNEDNMDKAMDCLYSAQQSLAWIQQHYTEFNYYSLNPAFLDDEPDAEP